MTRLLVVYYSWTGSTAKVAEAIAGELSADVEEIREVRRRAGPFAFIRAALQSMRETPAAIMPSVRDVADYDVVILGCPVWAQNMASPMRSYILREGSKFRQVAFFCTLGGAGGDAALAKMAALTGRPPVARLLVTAAPLKSGGWRDLVKAFARQISASPSPTRRDHAA